MQLINHGVCSSYVEKLKMEIQDFFNLPMSEKKKFWQTPQYMEGFGQIFVVSEEQKLDWADIFFMTTLPKHLRKPHLFPQLPLPLRLINFLFLLCLYVILFFSAKDKNYTTLVPNYKTCLKKFYKN
jgi:isopenicillin N synthase-like dioxygenase